MRMDAQAFHPLAVWAIALCVALTSNLLPPSLLVASILLLPLLALGYANPIAVFLLFIVTLPLVGDQELVGRVRPSVLLTGVAAVFAVVLIFRYAGAFALTLARLRGVIGALVLLALLGITSAFVNFNDEIVWNVFEAAFKPLFFALMMFAVVTAFNTRKRIEALSWAIVLGSAAVATYALFTYVAGTAPTPTGDTPRLAGTFEEYNALGSYMLLTSLFTLGFAQLQSSASRRLLLYVLFGAQSLALLLSLTLGSMLGLVTGLGVFFLLRGRKSRDLFTYVVVLSVALVAVVIFLPDVVDKVSIARERLMLRLPALAGGFTMIREHLLFGVGSKNVLAYLLENPAAITTAFGSAHEVPHNVFIDTFVQKGLFVLLALVGVLLTLMRLLVRYWRLADSVGVRGLAAGIAGSMVGFLQQNLSNNMLLHPRIGLFFFLFVPVLICFVDTDFDARSGRSLATNTSSSP